MKAYTEFERSGGDIGALIQNYDHQASGLIQEYSSVQNNSWQLFDCGTSMMLCSSVANAQPYLTHFVTSPTFFDSRPAVTQPLDVIKSTEKTVEKSSNSYEEALTMSITEQASEVSAALCINKSQLAEILGVSRPTLYSWFDGSNPNPVNRDRMYAILRILSKTHIGSHNPLNARFVRNPLTEKSKSLFDLLKTDPWSEEEIASVLETAKALSVKVVKKEEAREERWRKLGYEEPSFEERKATLNRNLTSLKLDRSI